LGKLHTDLLVEGGAVLAERRRAAGGLAWSGTDRSALADFDASLAAANPEARLRSHDTPDLTTALEPVVIEGLKSLTLMVNRANSRAGALDKRDAVVVLRTLPRAGYPLPPEPVCAWAVANGWPSRGAERLRDLAGPTPPDAAPSRKGRTAAATRCSRRMEAPRGGLMTQRRARRH
jgi:hypothetical protein